MIFVFKIEHTHTHPVGIGVRHWRHIFGYLTQSLLGRFYVVSDSCRFEPEYSYYRVISFLGLRWWRL